MLLHAGRSGERGGEKILQYSKLACRRRGEGGATAGAAGRGLPDDTRSRERRIWKRDQANQDLPRPSSSPLPRLLCQHRRPPFYTAATITAFEKRPSGSGEAGVYRQGLFRFFHVNYDLLLSTLYSFASRQLAALQKKDILGRTLQTGGAAATTIAAIDQSESSRTAPTRWDV